jgi:hypothetical protein
MLHRTNCQSPIAVERRRSAGEIFCANLGFLGLILAGRFAGGLRSAVALDVAANPICVFSSSAIA